MKSWKFTDAEGVLCCAYYDEMEDNFVVWDESSVIDGVVHIHHTYDCEEVEDYLNRGIWRRLS